MPDIWIRTDGNDQIATGHLMRCLSIARACANLGKSVCFLVADAQSESLLRERLISPSEFQIQCLHSDYQDMNHELPALRGIMQRSHAVAEPSPRKNNSWILVDSYYVTPSYLEALKEWGHVAYLDDLVSFPYPVDCIINYDISDNEKPDCYHMANRCLLGVAYTPLRMQFQNVSYAVRQDVKHIMISTGGTDPFQAAGKILERMMTKSADYEYHIVTSRLNPCLDKLTNLSSQHPNIHIYENVQDMARLMAQCDLAVSAGGTTLYELCAVGVPTISFAMTDNQLSAVQTFSSMNIIPYAGDIRTDIDGVLDAVCCFLNERKSSYSERLTASDKMRSFVDGHGAARIAKALG